jgi:hypothetical protein
LVLDLVTAHIFLQVLQSQQQEEEGARTAASAYPLQQRLMKEVMPAVMKGLVQLALEQPQQPLKVRPAEPSSTGMVP